MQFDWNKEVAVGITVCDKSGVILYMNDKAAKNFEKSGGRELIGRNLLDCHPEKAGQQIMAFINEGRTNCYTIEKEGIKKMLYQVPWYDQGTIKGLVEYIIELPAEVPHFIRD